MSAAWELYDRLIEEISSDITITQTGTVGKWSYVQTDEDGMGTAFTMPVESLMRQHSGTLAGMRLKDAAALAKSWNFAEAATGMAAINAWHSYRPRALDHGFTPCEENNWGRSFHPYAQATAGKTVAIIGHFPFAPAALPDVERLYVLERNVQPGDYPDTAAEYLLPTCDYVFISGSAFVNKTMPRLLELASDATTIIIGPSTPASPIIHEYGADVVTAFATQQPDVLLHGLQGQLPGGMYEGGARVQSKRTAL